MEDLFDLSGKVAIVTGSTKGIGKAIAAHMAFHGADVVVSSRKQDACDEVTKEINDAVSGRGGSATAIPCHTGFKEQLQFLVDETRSKLGKIDIVVCNAAVNPFYGSMLDVPDSAFEKILDSNIMSNHWLCRYVPDDAPRSGRRRQRPLPLHSGKCIHPVAPDNRPADNEMTVPGPHGLTHRRCFWR